LVWHPTNSQWWLIRAGLGAAYFFIGCGLRAESLDTQAVAGLSALTLAALMVCATYRSLRM
jgi:hypothetical protein